jgi:hypothetical protein
MFRLVNTRSLLCLLTRIFFLVKLSRLRHTGCQIFLGETYQNGEKYTKMYRMAVKHTIRPKNRQKGHLKQQHLPMQGLSQFTQIGIFGSKECHLAALLRH